MINGRIQNGDVKVEVESISWNNLAPVIAPTMESMGGMKGLISWGGNWQRETGSWTHWATPWTYGPIDPYGNRKWTTNAAMTKKVYGFEGFGYDLQGTPGKYYSMDLDVRTSVLAMNGHPDYIPQPPCRFRLYATNGVEAQDVIIAESGVINPILPEAPSWPFHPGYREWRLSLNPTQPMPTGKTYFRLQLEYDNDFTATKDIWLPASYTDSGSTVNKPPQFFMFAVRGASHVVYEHTGTDAEWIPSHGSPTMEYNWESQYVQYRGTTTTNHYIQTECVVTPEDFLTTHGIKVRFWSRWTESNLRVSINAVDGDNVWHMQTIGSVTAGWQELTWDAGTGPTFNASLPEQRLQIRFYSRSVMQPLVVADRTWDDFDGRTFYNYNDMTPWVSNIDINRYDTEVSTCSVVLREPTDYSGEPFDTGDSFEQGKRIRISTPIAYAGQTVSNYFGLAYHTTNTIFVGGIQKRTAHYPRNARKEVCVFSTNKFPLLQEKTHWSLANLEDYIRLIPAMGINSHYDSRGMVPWDRDPFVSLTGIGDVNDMWMIRDQTNGFTMFDALQLTRNSQFGYVYFDRWGRLHMKSTLPPSVMASFNDIPGDPGEESYADIDVSFDSSSIINSIRIREYQQVETINEDTFQRDDAIVETESTIYDLPSIKRYGKTEIDFRTFKKTTYTELRDHILDGYSVPQVTCSRVVVPIRDLAVLEKMILVDIYSLINVKYQDRIDRQHRVNRIKHTIVPGETWRMELGFNVNHDGVWW